MALRRETTLVSMRHHLERFEAAIAEAREMIDGLEAGKYPGYSPLSIEEQAADLRFHAARLEANAAVIRQALATVEALPVGAQFGE